MSELALVFHPLSSTTRSTAFVDAIARVLATPGALRLVSPYLSKKVLEPLVRGRDWRLVTDVNECFKSSPEPGLGKMLRAHAGRLRHLDLVHAKLVLGDSEAFFGSANLTKSGVCDRFELGCILNDVNLISQLANWFEGLWLRGEAVDSAFLRAAEGRGAEVRGAVANLKKAHCEKVASRRQRSAGGSLGWMTSEPGTSDRLVRASDDEGELAEFALALRKLSGTRSQAAEALDLLAEAIRVASLDMDDPRLHLTFGARFIAICINQRYVAWMERKQRVPVFGFLIPDFAVANEIEISVPGSSSGAFRRRKNPDAASLYVPLADATKASARVRDSWHQGIRAEVLRGQASSYSRAKRPFLYRALMVKSVRRKSLEQAFPAI